MRGSTNAIKPLHHYSTAEQIVGTWIDGKPIYERIIAKQDNMKSSSFEWVNNWLDTSNIPIDELIDCWLKCSATGVNGRMNPTQVKYNGTNIDMLFSANQSVNFNCEFAVIQYTKSTDTAPST